MSFRITFLSKNCTQAKNGLKHNEIITSIKKDSEATFFGQDIKYFSKESDDDDDDCLNSTPIPTKSLQNGTELPYN